MSTLWMRDGKLLFKDGKIMLASECCCGKLWCPPQTDPPQQYRECQRYSQGMEPEGSTPCDEDETLIPKGQEQQPILLTMSGAHFDDLNGVFELPWQGGMSWGGQFVNGPDDAPNASGYYWMGRRASAFVSLHWNATDGWRTFIEVVIGRVQRNRASGYGICKKVADYYDATIGPCGHHPGEGWPPDIFYGGCETYGSYGSTLTFGGYTNMEEAGGICVPPGRVPRPRGIVVGIPTIRSSWVYGLVGHSECTPPEYYSWSAVDGWPQCSDNAIEASV